MQVTQDVIQFPKNYERYITLAQTALQENAFEEAAKYFEAAYEISPEFPLSYLLVDTYLKIGNYQRGRELVEEHLQDYQRHQDFLALYVEVLVGVEDFLKAYEIVNQKLLSVREGQMLFWVQLKRMIEFSEGRYRKQHQAEFSAMKAELTTLQEEDLFSQLAFTQRLQQLPQKEFIDIGKPVMMTAGLHPLVRGGVLEKFHRIQYNRPVDFVDFRAQTQAYVPVKLEGMWENAAYQIVYQLLENQLLHRDPISLRNLETELRMFFSILYPVATEVIVNPKLFGKVYLASYQLTAETDLEKTAEAKEMATLISQLKALIHIFPV